MSQAYDENIMDKKSIELLIKLKFKELQEEIHSLAKEKGWWENSNIPEKLLMIHSEVSEAVECYRLDAIEYTDKLYNKPFGYPTELADIVIRVMDLAENSKIDLFEMIKIKHEYNKTRPYRHGGKKI